MSAPFYSNPTWSAGVAAQKSERDQRRNLLSSMFTDAHADHFVKLIAGRTDPNALLSYAVARAGDLAHSPPGSLEDLRLNVRTRWAIDQLRQRWPNAGMHFRGILDDAYDATHRAIAHYVEKGLEPAQPETPPAPNDVSTDPLVRDFRAALAALENGSSAPAPKASTPLDPLDDGVPDDAIVNSNLRQTARELRASLSAANDDDITGWLGWATRMANGDEFGGSFSPLERSEALLRTRIYRAELKRRGVQRILRA